MWQTSPSVLNTDPNLTVSKTQCRLDLSCISERQASELPHTEGLETETEISDVVPDSRNLPKISLHGTERKRAVA